MPLTQPLDCRCPECVTGAGLARAVATVVDRRNTLIITLVCASCGHQWNVERVDASWLQLSGDANAKRS